MTAIYAYVKENNPRAYVKERYNPQLQPRRDRDCQLGVKRSTNKEQADGSKKEEKEYLWRSGFGVATALVAGEARGGRRGKHPDRSPRTISPISPRSRVRSVASPPSRSTSMAIPRASVTAMACPCVPKGCACIPPSSFPTPTATALASSLLRF